VLNFRDQNVQLSWSALKKEVDGLSTEHGDIVRENVCGTLKWPQTRKLLTIDMQALLRKAAERELAALHEDLRQSQKVAADAAAQCEIVKKTHAAELAGIVSLQTQDRQFHDKEMSLLQQQLQSARTAEKDADALLAAANASLQSMRAKVLACDDAASTQLDTANRERMRALEKLAATEAACARAHAILAAHFGKHVHDYATLQCPAEAERDTKLVIFNQLF
jgi:hypothetical protein